MQDKPAKYAGLRTGDLVAVKPVGIIRRALAAFGLVGIGYAVLVFVMAW